jgi:glycosidase
MPPSPSSIDDPEVRGLLTRALRGQLPTAPFPSPTDWRDVWIYFVLIDRFNRHGGLAPTSTWNAAFGFRQGGDLEGVRERLPYLQDLGVKALWLSPVLKNAAPPQWEFNYHGYAAQDFLNLDERLASDGTRATAETELRALVDDAHARGMYVILDIVLNHAARVFDYERGGGPVADFQDRGVLDGPLGGEPDVEWLNGLGLPRSDWKNTLPAPPQLSPDDAVWPSELQRADLFRRRGGKVTDQVPPGPGGFVRGDFGSMRQLVVEYDAAAAGDTTLRRRRGRFPVLDVLIKAHLSLIARYDFDGFRVDTVKYVHPDLIETFGNAVREFALGIGKKNFFTFGEIYDEEPVVAAFVGRNGGGPDDGFGIDAALDFPLFFKLPGVAKGLAPVESIRAVFDARKRQEAELLSTHGEAGRYFVSFLDNHDQSERIRHPQSRTDQVTLAVAAMFALQGIPSLYYGTEQQLDGTHPDRPQYEGVREALWGKPDAFAQDGATYVAVKNLARLRDTEAPLRYGRLYFRQVAGNGVDFGMPRGAGGVLAFSRTLAGREVLIVANTEGDVTRPAWQGLVIVDLDLNETPQSYEVGFSNRGTGGAGTVQLLTNAVFWNDANQPGAPARAAALFVVLAPGELQILVPT